jgi:hypothetical protein
MQSLNDMDQHLQTMQVALVNLAAINAIDSDRDTDEMHHYQQTAELNIKAFGIAFSQLSNRDIVRLLMNRESLNPLNTKPHPLWALNSTQESLVQFELDPNSDNKLKRKNQNETAAARIGHCQMTINGIMPNGATVYAGSRVGRTNSQLHTDYAEHIQHESGTLHNSVVFRNFMTFLTHNQTQRIVRERMKQFQSSEKNAAILIAIPFVLGGLIALAPLFMNLSTTPTLLAGLIAHAPVVLGLMTLCGALYKLLQLNAFFDNMLNIQNIPDTGAEEGIYLGQYNTLIQEGLTLFMASCSSIQRSIIGFFTESDTPESNQVAPAESHSRRPATDVAVAPASSTRASCASCAKTTKPGSIKKIKTNRVCIT